MATEVVEEYVVVEDEEIVEEEIIEETGEVYEEEILEEPAASGEEEIVEEDEPVDEPEEILEEEVIVEMVSNDPDKPMVVLEAELAAQERLENYRRKREARLEAEAKAEAERKAELEEKLNESDAIQAQLMMESSMSDLSARQKNKEKMLAQKAEEEARLQAEFEAEEKRKHDYLQSRLDESAKDIERENATQEKRYQEFMAKKEAERAAKEAAKAEKELKRKLYEERRSLRKSGKDIPPELLPSPSKAKAPAPAPAPAPEPAPEVEEAPAPVPEPAPKVEEAPSEPAPQKAKAKEGQSSSFQMFKEMECKEEYQKLKMAGFLRELQKLAQEEKQAELRESLQASSSDVAAEKSKKMEGGGNISLDGIDLTQITPEVADDKIEALYAGRGKGDDKLDPNSLLQLQQAAIKVMGEQDTVVDLRDKGFKTVTVVGDLHGSLDCLNAVIKLVGLDRSGENAKDGQVVIFDGDYVDRGENSLEVLCTLMLLKLSRPDRVHLLRGNHEDTMTASIYGFRDEIGDKYEDPDVAEEIWYEFGTVFASIPICAWTKQAAIMHGGIPSKGFSLERLKAVDSDLRVQLKTVVDPYDQDEEVIQGVMWSDPTSEPGIAPNDRGGGSIFGPDVTKAFLKEHGVRYVIRAHEPFEEGTDHIPADEDGSGVVTIFSTSNYPNGEGTNLGAVLHLDEEKGEYETVTFRSSSAPEAEDDDGSAQYGKVLKMFVDDHRTKLTKSFRSHQDSDGSVTPEQWAQVVGEELGLHDVNWVELQPKLAPAEESGNIDWGSFLNKYSSKLPNKGQLEDDQLSILHEHKDKFLNIFQLLDADGSGTIDEQEFIQGIETLNQQGGGTGIKDPKKIWKVFDIDGDGEISIEEFCKGLEQSATMQNLTNNLDAKEVESLQENHEMLLMAFKYLDSDKSGAIDFEEFSRGVELLNKRLPERNQLGDPAELFKLLDADGSGDIDINEFNGMFAGM